MAALRQLIANRDEEIGELKGRLAEEEAKVAKGVEEQVLNELLEAETRRALEAEALQSRRAGEIRAGTGGDSEGDGGGGGGGSGSGGGGRDR